MNPVRKATRKRLKKMIRVEFERAVHDALLSQEEIEILRQHIVEGKTFLEIAEQLNCCEGRVAERTKSCYDKISRSLSSRPKNWT